MKTYTLASHLALPTMGVGDLSLSLSLSSHLARAHGSVAMLGDCALMAAGLRQGKVPNAAPPHYLVFTMIETDDYKKF
eukprot:951258-Heterocapsa_arctica.AAC.1